ncbi:alpha/beta hydrolase [Sphingobium sp. AN558]|uniref:alpha/beta fold hydrolase n=1 Tax=Sphingobium sp. AN558 TaxID=3133442 RepID=UPI0030C5E057
MPYTDVNGLRFHYEDDDFTDPWNGPETVFIQHGWGRSTEFFYHWVPRLANKYRVIRRDMRGHGLSEDPPVGKPWTVEELVSDMVGFFDALNLDKVHYIGESAGGVLGVALAASHPERLRSLTVMSAPLTDPTRNSESYGYTDLAEVVLSTPMERVLDMLIKGRGVVPISAAHERWMRQEWEKNRPESLAALTRLFPDVDLSPLLPDFKVPTLILAPANSQTAPLDEQKRMHKLLSNSRMEIIDGSGHEIYFERFEECMAAVQSFLALNDD